MPITVQHDCFVSAAEALAQLASAELHTMTLPVPAVNNSAHWHHFDAVFYILEGSLQLTDVASGEQHQCVSGARISVPARTLHFEHSAEGYQIALGTSVPAAEFGEPVDLPPAALES